MRFQILTAKILFDFYASDWNIRGLQANREELGLLSFDLHPTVICLQETFLTESKKHKFQLLLFLS